MKKFNLTLLIILLALVFTSCSRGITIYEAANGKAKCGRHIR